MPETAMAADQVFPGDSMTDEIELTEKQKSLVKKQKSKGGELEQKRALTKFFRTGHPQEPDSQVFRQVDRFIKSAPEPQESLRQTWQRAIYDETGHCTTGASPKYERVPGGRIIEVHKRVGAVAPPPKETVEERLARENQELKLRLHELEQQLKKAVEIMEKQEEIIKDYQAGRR